MANQLRAELYKDRVGEWRWRIRAPNGRVIDSATEGFTGQAGAMANYELVTVARNEIGGVFHVIQDA